MIAIRSLLDGLSAPSFATCSSSPSADQADFVKELVATALDAHRHIEALDTYGPRKKNRRYLTDPNARLFRKMHEDWLADAEALQDRVRTMESEGQVLDPAQELEVAVLATRALLSCNMEKIAAGLDSIRQGNYVTLEEARRGVRDQARK
jgi:hypothetical protein